MCTSIVYTVQPVYADCAVCIYTDTGIKVSTLILVDTLVLCVGGSMGSNKDDYLHCWPQCLHNT